MSAAAGAVSYLVLGDSRAAAVRATLATCIARWRTHWAPAGAAPAHVELHLQAQTPLLACGGHSGGIRLSVDGMPQLEILTQVDVLACMVGLAGSPAGAPLLQVAQHRDLAEELRVEILRNLAQSVAAVAGLRDVAIDAVQTTLAETARRAHAARCLCASIGFGKAAAQVLLFIGPQLIERLLPARPEGRASGALEAATRAIGEGNVYVEALLGYSELSLRELASLAPGDVVILDHDLQEAGRLEVRGHPFARTTLGRSDELRAVRVASFTQGV